MLEGASARFQIGWKRANELDDPMIEVRYTALDRMRHRQPVLLEQRVVWQPEATVELNDAVQVFANVPHRRVVQVLPLRIHLPISREQRLLSLPIEELDESQV